MRLTPSHFHILLTVAQAPSHGYAIKQEVDQRTEGRAQLGPGSLYWAIKRLADAGLLEETAAPSRRSDGPSRRYYVGTVVALAMMPLLRSFLVGVTPSDPLTILVVVVTFLGVASVASFLPAFRAARIDPTSTLRFDA
jgi:hypothetical protein